jgi:hypothetical protein
VAVSRPTRPVHWRGPRWGTATLCGTGQKVLGSTVLMFFRCFSLFVVVFRCFSLFFVVFLFFSFCCDHSGLVAHLEKCYIAFQLLDSGSFDAYVPGDVDESVVPAMDDGEEEEDEEGNTKGGTVGGITGTTGQMADT